MAQLTEALRYKQEGCGFDSRWFIGIFFRPHYGPGFDSASNRNEYQGYFLGGKGGRCVEVTTLLPSCADCLEIWASQPPGSLRACPGIALSFTLRNFRSQQGCLKVKGQVVTAHFKKAYKWLEVYLHLFVTFLSAGGCEWSTSRPSHFKPGKEPRYLLNRGLGGPQGWSGRFREEKNVLPLPGFRPRTVQPAAYAIPALMLCSMST